MIKNLIDPDVTEYFIFSSLQVFRLHLLFYSISHRIKESMPGAKFKIVDLASGGETFKARIRIKGTHFAIIPSLKKMMESTKTYRQKDQF